MSAPHSLTLARAIVCCTAPLVPAGLRVDWRREWEAELASLMDLPHRHRRPVRRALGALADAFWLRQRNLADFDWIDDLHHGVRQLVRHGSFAATAVAILALGLASTVTMFSVTDQILLRPLPYPEANRIMTIYETREPGQELLDPAPANFLDWRTRGTSFEFLAGLEPWSMDVAGDPRPEVWTASKVTPGFFEAFAVQPLLGRFFSEEEYHKGRDRVIVLGEAFWRQRFGANPAVIGQAIRTDDGPHTIVGIVPATFEPRLLESGARRR